MRNVARAGLLQGATATAAQTTSRSAGFIGRKGTSLGSVVDARRSQGLSGASVMQRLTAAAQAGAHAGHAREREGDGSSGPARQPSGDAAPDQTLINGDGGVEPADPEELTGEEEETDELEIETETLLEAPNDSDMTRRTVGVGETVIFRANRQGTWSCSAGNIIAGLQSQELWWSAPNRAATAGVTLTAGDKSLKVDITVVEPDGIEVQKLADETYPAGQQGAGMTLSFTITPLNVSLDEVEIKEIPGPATNVTGLFVQALAAGVDLSHVPSPDFNGIDDANVVEAEDLAAHWGVSAPWSPGSYTWVIPNNFRVSGEGGNGVEFCTTTQTIEILDDRGTTSVTKEGASTQRTP